MAPGGCQSHRDPWRATPNCKEPGTFWYLTAKNNITEHGRERSFKIGSEIRCKANFFGRAALDFIPPTACLGNHAPTYCGNAAWMGSTRFYKAREGHRKIPVPAKNSFRWRQKAELSHIPEKFQKEGMAGRKRRSLITLTLGEETPRTLWPLSRTTSWRPG